MATGYRCAPVAPAWREPALAACRPHRTDVATSGNEFLPAMPFAGQSAPARAEGSSVAAAPGRFLASFVQPHQAIYRPLTFGATVCPRISLRSEGAASPCSMRFAESPPASPRARSSRCPSSQPRSRVAARRSFARRTCRATHTRSVHQAPATTLTAGASASTSRSCGRHSRRSPRPRFRWRTSW